MRDQGRVAREDPGGALLGRGPAVRGAQSWSRCLRHAGHLLPSPGDLVGLVPVLSAVLTFVGAPTLTKSRFGLLLAPALTAAGLAVARPGSGVPRVLERRPRGTVAPVAALVRAGSPLTSGSVVVTLDTNRR